MAWHSITVRSGDEIASLVLARANDPGTWSLETLGAIVFRQARKDADSFFFCPRASVVFDPVIAGNNGEPCVSPLMSSLRHTTSWRILLGFKTDWQLVQRVPRRQRQRMQP
jgi:hypothetical protein